LCRTIPAAVVTGTALAVGPFSYSQAPPPAVARQGYTAGRFAFELDGQFAGPLKSFAGGAIVQDVLAPGSTTVNGIRQKRLAGVKYEDIVLTCGTGMSGSFYDWIKATLEKQYIRRNGSLLTCNYNYQVMEERNLYNSLISEIAFPACDAASKEPINFTIKLTPEEIRWTKGGTLPGGPKPSTKETSWLPSNFRMSIPALDCSVVNKIEAISVIPALNRSQDLGISRFSGTASSMQMSSLVVTLPEAHAEGFYRWKQDSLAGRTAGSDPGRFGQLDYLDVSLRGSLFSLSFLGLALQRLVPVKVSAGREQVRLVTAEMYYKDLRFAYGAAASA
jgi:hypothetical protein